MPFTWQDVAHEVAALAPTAGSLLGGPAGTAIGNLIAATLGTAAEPDKVMAAIQTDPAAAVKLKELELNHRLEMEKLAVEAEKNRLAQETAEMQEASKQIESVNVTMRAEAASEHWFSAFWRPYWGVISGTAFGAAVVFIGLLAYKAVVEKDHEAMRMIPDLVVSMAELFAIPGAILGITAWHRGRMQRVQAGDSDVSVAGALVDRLRTRKKEKTA